ncbi:unnamed protein product [Caenorhabditis sp. 36 PRJEB53466]|nr:unnamed protein product [Caenorhabditis sp. 36 PRJEB53466]
MPILLGKEWYTAQKSTILYEDITDGLERFPIPVISSPRFKMDTDIFEHFKYSTRIIDVDANLSSRRATPTFVCKCKGQCDEKCDCSSAVYGSGGTVEDMDQLMYDTVRECNENCECALWCGNRVAQKGAVYPVEIFARDPWCGWGVRASVDVPFGSFVGEYTGELIDDEEATERCDSTFLFETRVGSETFTIDAKYSGNYTRFINHSCSPNVKVAHVSWDFDEVQLIHMCFYTNEPIKKGDELTIDYGEAWWANKQKMKESSSYHSRSGKKAKQPKIEVEIGAPEPVEEQQKVLTRPNSCTVLAVVVTLFLLFLLIAGLGQFGLHEKSAFEWENRPVNAPRKRLNLPCQTHECVHYSADLSDIMDPSVDPCDDFHTHVCAGYDPRKRRWEQLLKLIDTKNSKEHSQAFRLVRKMLRKCAAERREGEKVDVEMVLSLILPSPPLLFPLLSPNSTFNASAHALTSLLIHVALHTPDDVGLFGIQPSSDSEFSLFIVKPANPTLLTLYEVWNILEILKMPRGTSSDVQQQIEQVLELQNRLNEIAFDARPDIIKLSEIQSKMPFIDWKTLTDSLYDNNIGGGGSLAEKVFGFNTTYYEEVSSLLSEFPPQTVFNLIVLRFAHHFLRSEVSADRQETCLHQVAATIPGKTVLYGTAEPRGLKLLNQMLGTIREHLRTSLTTLKWMDAHAITEVKRKFERTKFTFGFQGEHLIQELTIDANCSWPEILRQILEWQTRNMFKSIAENNESIFLSTEVFYSVQRNQLTAAQLARKARKEEEERLEIKKNALEKEVERLAEEVETWKWRHEEAERIHDVLKDQVDDLSRDNQDLSEKIDREQAAHRETIQELQELLNIYKAQQQKAMQKSRNSPSSDEY